MYTLTSRGLSTLVKELTAVTRVMQSYLTNWTLWYPIAENINKRKLLIGVIIPELTYVTEMAEQLDTMSSEMLGGFRFHHPVFLIILKSCDTTKQSVNDNIYNCAKNFCVDLFSIQT